MYFCLAVLCITLSNQGGVFAFVWLANGFAFAVLLRKDQANWVLFVLSMLVANIVANILFLDSLTFSVLASIVNMLQYLSAAWCALRLFSLPPYQRIIPHVLGLLSLYGLLVAPIVALIGGGLVYWQYDGPFFKSWLSWWLGDIIGVLFCFIPAYCFQLKKAKKAFTWSFQWRWWGTLVVFTSISYAVLDQFQTPYIFISVLFVLSALFLRLVYISTLTFSSLVIAHLVPFIFGVKSPDWILSLSIDYIMMNMAAMVFMSNIIALAMGQLRQQQKELITVKERFELAGNSIGLGIWDWNLDTQRLLWDERMYQLYDMDPNTGKETYATWRTRVHPDDIDIAEKLLTDLIADKGEYRADFRVNTKDEKERWITASGCLIKNEAGKPIRIVGLNWESTQRKQAEFNYKNQQMRTKAVIDAAEAFSIIFTDLNGTIEMFSRGAEKMLGYSAQEMEFKQTPIVFHDLQEVLAKGEELSREYNEDVQGFDVFVKKAREGERDTQNWTYIHKDGHQLPVRLSVSRVEDSNKQLIGFLGISQNITLEVETNQAMRFALTQINEQAAAADEARKQIEGIFNIAPESFLVVNSDGEIIQANAQAHRLFKYQQGGLIGINVDRLVPDASHSHHKKLRKGFLRNQRARVMGKGSSLKAKCSDGELIPVDINLAPYTVGSTLHTVVTIHDVSTQYEIQELLTDAAAKAEATSRAKSEFVASMSHEIRTPMNAVLASSQLLKKTQLTHDQNRYVNMIHSSSNALLGILNDILDFSKIEAGKFELQSSVFDMNDLCETLAGIMSANAARKNIELVFDVDTGMHHQLIGDAPRLQQVLINLIGNAIKFTEHGEVQLQIKVESKSIDKASVYFCVKDTGIGIEKNEIYKLFSAFSQVDASNTRKYGGTGLGLVISQRLIRMMGGEIQVESELDDGSEFYFSLEMPTKKAADPYDKKMTDFKFVVMDENQSSRRCVMKYLNDFGAKVRDAEVADITNTYESDFLLINWNDQTKESLAKATNSIKQRVFIMNAPDGDSQLDEHIRNQIAGIIQKPVLKRALYDELVRVLIPQSNKVDTIAETNKQPLKGVKILLVEDNALNQLVATEILEDLGASINVANNGKEAIDHLSEPKNIFDLVLMDVQMPIMDGYTATRKIRTELELNIPVLAMTAGVMQKEQQQCIDAGMNDFISKPIDIPNLVSTILSNI